MKTAIKILCFLFCFGVLSAQAAEQYSGTYHGRRVIGKHLAEFCQIADDTVASDMKGLKECLEKLATKLRAGEPKVQEEGQKEYQEILTEQLVYLLGGGKSKNASAPNYEEDYNMSLKQAVHSEGSDIHTQETATAATTEKQMTSMLDAISLLYEKMKLEALNQVPLMNPDLKPVFPANGDMENVEFSGLLENVQMVPNSLAVYCQMNGSDFADTEKKEQVKKCLDTIISKLNVTAEERKDNHDDYTVIVNEQALYMLMQAVERSTGSVDYARARQTQDKDNSETMTVFEDTTAIASADMLNLEAMNDFLHLYATEAKYRALKNLALVDADAVVGQLRESAAPKEAEEFNAEVTQEGVSVTVDGPIMVETGVDEEETTGEENSTPSSDDNNNNASEIKGIDNLIDQESAG